MHDALSHLWGRLYRKHRACESDSLRGKVLHVVGFCVVELWLWIAKVRWGVRVENDRVLGPA